MALDSSDREPDERADAQERAPDPQPTQEMTAPFDALAGDDALRESRAADHATAGDDADPPGIETVDAEPVDELDAAGEHEAVKQFGVIGEEDAVDEHGATTRMEPIGPPPPDLSDPGAAFDTIAHEALPAAPERAAARLELDTPDFGRLRAADFPVVWRGYDPQAVDAYVREVTRAVDQFEQRSEPTAAVQRALGRVGEQTAAILQQAEQAAEETTRSSRAAADDRVERARREADELHEQAVAKVRALDDDVERLWQERQRLIDATKELADQLRAVAEQGEARFPPAAAAPDGPLTPQAAPPSDPPPEPLD